MENNNIINNSDQRTTGMIDDIKELQTICSGLKNDIESRITKDVLKGPGSLITGSATGEPVGLDAAGESGMILTSDPGVDGGMKWMNPTPPDAPCIPVAAFQQGGDLLVGTGNTDGPYERIAVGSLGNILTVGEDDQLEWREPNTLDSGGGTMTGALRLQAQEDENASIMFEIRNDAGDSTLGIDGLGQFVGNNITVQHDSAYSKVRLCSSGADGKSDYAGLTSIAPAGTENPVLTWSTSNGDTSTVQLFSNSHPMLSLATSDGVTNREVILDGTKTTINGTVNMGWPQSTNNIFNDDTLVPKSDVVSAVGAVTGSSLGGTAAVFASKTGTTLNMRGITAGAGITVTQNDSDLTITNADGASNLTGKSLGGTAAVFASKAGTTLSLRGITGGTGITVTENASDITITNADGWSAQRYLATGWSSAAMEIKLTATFQTIPATIVDRKLIGFTISGSTFTLESEAIGSRWFRVTYTCKVSVIGSTWCEPVFAVKASYEDDYYACTSATITEYTQNALANWCFSGSDVYELSAGQNVSLYVQGKRGPLDSGVTNFGSIKITYMNMTITQV